MHTHTTSLCRIEWQRRSQLAHGSAHSLLISLLRGLAALQVAAAHLRSEAFPGMRELGNPPLAYQVLAFATGFAHQAVVVFFLVSGWLVGGSLLDKIEQRAPALLRGYVIDRLSRLWTVLVPALLLMLAIGFVTGDTRGAGGEAYSLAAFAGNLAGLQTVLVANFSGNYALWSLANETWYYVQFPLLLLVFMRGNPLRQAGAAAALILLATTLPLPITVYFGLWLLGVLCSRLRIHCRPAVPWVLAGLALALSLVFRIKGHNDDLNLTSIGQDLVYSLPLLAILCALQRPFRPVSAFQRGVARTAAWLSEFSFTLYVTHLPLIKLMRYLALKEFGRDKLAPDAPFDYVVYLAALAILVLAAYLSYRLFEAHTFRVRRVLKSIVAPHAAVPA